MEFGSVLLVVLMVLLGAALYINRQQAAGARTNELTIATLKRSVNQTQDTLQLTKSQMNHLASVTFDAILVVDTQKHVTLMNEVARDVFHVEQDAGQTLMTVTRHYPLEAMVDKVLAVSEPIEDQLDIGGRSFKVRVTRLDSGSVALALQDVTELLRLTRARRDMVANISHELRTPISSIRLLVDTLSHNIGRNPERDTKLLGKIANETDSLQFLTEELHDLSMIESGRAIMRMVKTPFNAIARDAISRMTAQLDKHKMELVNAIPDDLCVLADPDQTRRVLTNLISNSIKFTPSAGKLTLNAEPNGSMVTIRVSDTGPGIPPGERTRVFERFYQVDTARTGGVQGGSGLGLSIAKHIIEAQGGKIWAEAAIPHGTCISFTLPQPES